MLSCTRTAPRPPWSPARPPPPSLYIRVAAPLSIRDSPTLSIRVAPLYPSRRHSIRVAATLSIRVADILYPSHRKTLLIRVAATLYPSRRSLSEWLSLPSPADPPVCAPPRPSLYSVSATQSLSTAALPPSLSLQRVCHPVSLNSGSGTQSLSTAGLPPSLSLQRVSAPARPATQSVRGCVRRTHATGDCGASGPGEGGRGEGGNEGGRRATASAGQSGAREAAGADLGSRDCVPVRVAGTAV